MNQKIMTQICDKTMGGDFTAEISMPDYEPEVRRLLRASVTLTPPIGFCDTIRMGMNGEIIYDILYAGNDGALYSTRTRETYELSEAFKPSEKAISDMTLLCEATPESLISRATAPRKISLRCKVRGKIKAIGEQEISERTTYIENPDSIRRLTEECEYTYIFPSAICEARISDDFPAELPSGISGDIRIISYTATAVSEAIEPARDEAVVKGTLYLNALATVDDDGSAPFRLARKISFAEVVDMDGLDPSCRCTATVCCTDCEFTVEENNISCEPSITIKLDAEQDRRSEYTKDMFSTEFASDSTLKRYEFPVSEKLFSGNFTVSLHEPAPDLGFDENANIIDVTANASVKNIESSNNKKILSGEAVLNVLGEEKDELCTKEIRIPFKYEIDGSDEPQLFTECSVVAIEPRVKLDNGKLSCDCELHASGRTYIKSGFEALDEVIFGDALKTEDVITVCFPSPTDSVWDIAKRYHVSPETISANNPNAKRGDALIF